MKKSLFHIIAVAVAILPIASCQEEIKVPNSSATHTVVFSAEQVATKTSISIDGTTVHYSWKQSDTEGNKFKVFEDGVAAVYVMPELKDGKMSITATFPSEEAPVNAKYLARFNSEINASQFGDETEYAQDSDIMVSEEAEGDINDDGIMFRFTRVSALGQVTLKNLGKGEFVNSVIIETTDGKILAAAYDFDNNQFAAEGSASINIETLSTITDGQAIVRFVTVPVQDALLKITATTIDSDENVVATYEKTFTKSISFTANNLRVFGVQMEEKEEDTPVETEVEHTISWSSYEDWDGVYLDGSNIKSEATISLKTMPYGYSVVLTKAASSYTNPTVNKTANDARQYADGTVTISNEKTITKLVFNISTQGLTRLSEITASTGTIATQAEGDATVEWTGNAKSVTFTVGKNAVYGSDGESKAGQLDFDSIDATYLSEPLPTVNVTGVSLNNSSLTIAAGGKETLVATVSPDNATNKNVSWSTSDASIATVSNGVVTGVSVGTATITATTEDGGKTATCAVTVTTATSIKNTIETAYTPSEAIALIDAGEDLNTEVYVKGYVSGIVTEFDSYYGNISFNVSSDGKTSSDQFEFFRNFKGANKTKWTASEAPKVGDYVIGYGKLIKYGSTYEFAEGNYIVSLVRAPYLKATASKTNISAAGETVTITVDTNVEGWTVASDNAAFTVGAKSGNTVPVTVSENTSTTDGRTANITVSATGVPDVVISLTQAKAAGGGQGGTIAKGTILWAENFAHFGTKTPSDAGTGTGTTIYGDAQIAYSQSSTNTKGYNENLAGSTAPELLLSKSNQTWTISGISCDGASEMTLTFLSNRTTFAVSSSTDNINVSGSQKSWTITNTGAKSFDITIKNTGSSNARIDDVELKVN